MDIRVIRRRRRTLCLTLDKSGEVVVLAPTNVGEEEIEGFVARHRRWIAARRREASLLPPAPSLADGSVLTLFDRNYTLSTGRTGIYGDVIYLPQGNREREFFRVLKGLTEMEMGALTERIAARYQFKYRGVRVSSAHGRWGSCNRDGMIAFSCFTAFLPERLFTYVCVHELCHTRVFSHSAAFWKEMDGVQGDWKTRRAELKKFAFVMHYFQKK